MDLIERLRGKVGEVIIVGIGELFLGRQNEELVEILNVGVLCDCPRIVKKDGVIIFPTKEFCRFSEAFAGYLMKVDGDIKIPLANEDNLNVQIGGDEIFNWLKEASSNGRHMLFYGALEKLGINPDFLQNRECASL